MFIIFGTKNIIKNYGLFGNDTCERCHNVVQKGIYCDTLWFTLFFIPVIPLTRHHFIGCPICGCHLDISKAQFREIINGNHNTVSETQSEENKYAGKTETQIAYLKQMEELEKQKQDQQSKV